MLLFTFSNGGHRGIGRRHNARRHLLFLVLRVSIIRRVARRARGVLALGCRRDRGLCLGFLLDVLLFRVFANHCTRCSLGLPQNPCGEWHDNEGGDCVQRSVMLIIVRRDIVDSLSDPMLPLRKRGASSDVYTTMPYCTKWILVALRRENNKHRKRTQMSQMYPARFMEPTTNVRRKGSDGHRELDAKVLQRERVWRTICATFVRPREIAGLPREHQALNVDGGLDTTYEH